MQLLSCSSLIVVKQRFRLILSPVTSQPTLSTTYYCYYSMPHFYYLRMHINTCTAERSANTEPAIPDCLDGNYLFAPCWKVNKLGARHS